MATGKTQSMERFQVSLKTPAGQLTAPVEVPSGFIPVTAIVPLMRRLGEQAQTLEEQQAAAAGKTISCQKGCAACCRMLVPVSAPEAFALKDLVRSLPEPRRQTILNRLEEARVRLEQAGLLERLTEVAETERQLSDEEMEPTNRDYYALRMPCPFLEDEICTIHEDRPAACRELLVTSPAALCEDMTKNPVQTLPVPVRMSTALGMLWSEVAGGPTRLIPLPLAVEWADRHANENRTTWSAGELLERGLDKVHRYLTHEFASRQAFATEGQPTEDGNPSASERDRNEEKT